MRPSRRRWTPEEDAILLTHDVPEAAAILRRTEGAVYVRRSRIAPRVVSPKVAAARVWAALHEVGAKGATAPEIARTAGLTADRVRDILARIARYPNGPHPRRWRLP